jgi:hypothetical protein
MPTKKKLLNKSEKHVADQNIKPEIEEYEKTSGKKLNVTRAPAIDVQEKLEKEWTDEEEEREQGESEEFTNEGMGIEKQEEKGEEAYPEIKEAISNEADEEEEEEEAKEEKEKEDED